ncbi:MAG: hypothetical protein Q9191_007158 [Dirinaria sp. TL-2023a]
MDTRNLRQILPDNQKIVSNDVSRDFPQPNRAPPQSSRPIEGSYTQRKPTPSPLQVSETPAYNADEPLHKSSNNPASSTALRTASDSQYSHSPRSPRLNLAANPSSPKSPRDRLDELLASEASATKDIEGAADNRGTAKVGKPAPPKAQSHSQLRNFSSPLPQTRPLDNSPPQSPLSSTSTNVSSATMRPDNRSFPRTSSIDSAISNISSMTSHSHNSSQDSFRPSTPDISNLINAAGSAEAVIHHLLKDKHHAAAQNAQLWKLVDKQRALVLGLNQDLDRALKDKERYRKRLKEHLSQVPAIPTSQPRGPLQCQKHERTSSGPKDTHMELPIQGNKVRECVAREARGKEANSTNISRSGQSKDQVTSARSRTSSESEVQAPALSDDLVKPSPGRAVPALQTSGLEGNKTSGSLDSSPQSAGNVISPSSFTAKRSNNLQRSFTGPALALTEPTPISVGDQSALPFRKLPPAPLDLHKPKTSANKPSDFGPEDHSESEYEDKVEADELPSFERGRKKTREEDDKEREVAAIKQQIERSGSKKDKHSKPPSEPAPAKSGGSLGSTRMQHAPMPLGIKSLSPPPTSNGSTGVLSAPTSLAGVLNPPTEQQRRSSSEGKIMSAPLSPGLPLSPRPGDRPMNSPTPRMPRDSKTSSVMSPPLSARTGLPLSPRAPRQPIPMPPQTPMSMLSPTAQQTDLRPEPLSMAQRPVSPPQASPPAVPPPTNLPIRGPPTPLPPNSLPPAGAPQSQTHGSKTDTELLRQSTRNDLPEEWRPEGVYKGFLSDAYPHFLIPPNALPSIRIKVMSSRLKPSRYSYVTAKGGDDEPVFTLGVSARSNMQELWQVEKSVLSLPLLDNQIKESSNFNVKLPDRSLFSGHAPAKIDARRVALEAYFETVLDTPMDERAASVVCRYLSTQVIEPRADNPSGDALAPEAGSPVTLGPDGRLLKEGFLTKRGKNFGGWKARYFVLDKPVLRYYESPGGSLLGTIRLQNAQIGKQSQQSQSPPRVADDNDSHYRHAFLILEPKRKDSNSHVRHVLCAESDAERDVWVNALLHYVDGQGEDERPRPSLSHTDSGSNKLVRKYIAKKEDSATESPETETFNELRAVGYESTVAAQAPVIQIVPEQRPNDSPSPTTASIQSSVRTHGSHVSKPISGPSNGVKIEDAGAWGSVKPISGPSNGVKIEDAGAWGNKSAMAPPNNTKEKKRSNFWGFTRDRHPSDYSTTHSMESNISLPLQPNVERAANVRPAFGIPLAEAVEYCAPKDMPEVCLPAVVYRSLEYLEAQDAANEEGIFRLSGSNVVIRSLRDRFNNEGDFDILGDEQYFDVHAVASLLKLYLRELPSTVLTRELHLEFLKVLDLEDKSKKIAAYNVLVHRLPKANWALLRALSAFLISIINNSDINKMSVRNVGIVFSPTLNIPAPVFAMFLNEFDAIFGEEPEDPSMTPPEVSITEPLTPEDIRSPRRQMFSDIPTPSYTQDSFPHLQQHKPLQPSYEQFPHGPDADHDTGMIPIQPSYETSISFQPSSSTATQPGAGYGVTARKPSADSAAKARRRESSMLLMSTQRKSSLPLLRGNAGKQISSPAFENVGLYLS